MAKCLIPNALLWAISMYGGLKSIKISSGNFLAAFFLPFYFFDDYYDTSKDYQCSDNPH